MDNQEKLVQAFGSTVWLAGKFAEGMSHEQSLAVPDFPANNFNWVLGHIIVGRDRVLALFDAPLVFSDDQRALYETGSGRANAETAITLDELLAALDQSQERIGHALSGASQADLDRIYNEERGQTVQQRIEGLHWHETYHLGQLEILRQIGEPREAYP